jgi:chitodextrinase
VADVTLQALEQEDEMKRWTESGWKLIGVLLTAMFLWGCGGGGGDDTPSASSVNLNGIWQITETAGPNTCGDTGGDSYTLTAVQEGTTLTVSDQYGRKFVGSVNGNKIQWTGSYQEDGGTTTITSMDISVSSDSSNFSGTTSWTWTDGVDTCSGKTSVSGNRISSGGGGGDADDTQAPTVPSGFAATATSPSQISLSWNASNDNVGIAGYNVYRGGFFLKEVTGLTTIDTGLSPGTNYCYQVSAVDAAGNESAQTNQVCATTFSGLDTTPPTTPTGLSVSATSSNQINLAWNASTDNVAVTGYKIYRGGIFLKIITSGTTTTDTGLSPGTNYCYRVSAVDAAGNESAQANQVCATTFSSLDITPPTTPTGLSVSATSSSQINLAWSASTDNVAVTGYKIYRSGAFLKIITSGTTTTDTGLSPGTYYCYQVSAVDAAGNESPKSTQMCATTQSQVCTPNQTRCVPNDIEKSETCNASGTAWVKSTCAQWSLCSNKACRPICGITSTPTHPTVCMVPNKDGVNNGEWITWYDNRLAVPTYVTGRSLLKNGGYASILSSGETWPYAWSIATGDGVNYAFKLNQFYNEGFKTPRVSFRIRRAGVINGSTYWWVGAGNGGTSVFSQCFGTYVGLSWMNDNCVFNYPYNQQFNYQGGWNYVSLGVNNGGFSYDYPDLIDVNYLKLSIE